MGFPRNEVNLQQKPWGNWMEFLSFSFFPDKYHIQHISCHFEWLNQAHSSLYSAICCSNFSISALSSLLYLNREKFVSWNHMVLVKTPGKFKLNVSILTTLASFWAHKLSYNIWKSRFYKVKTFMSQKGEPLGCCLVTVLTVLGIDEVLHQLINVTDACRRLRNHNCLAFLGTKKSATAGERKYTKPIY